MRKFSWIISCAILAICLIFAIPAEAQAAEIVDSGTCSENLTWTLDDTGTLTIYGTGAMPDYSHGRAPWYSAVYNYVENVVITEGVTSIGTNAFSDCSELVSVTIPSSVEKIGEYAFSECSRLKNVYITDIKSWCETSFGNAQSNPMYNNAQLYVNLVKAEELIIPAGTSKISGYAFYNCTSLVSLEVPDSITHIGDYAFYECSKLVSMTVPQDVTSIGAYAFYGCTSLSGDITLNKVTSINGYTFYNCTNLKSLKLPDSVTGIGIGAFYGCKSLVSINIPHGITSIAAGIFTNCNSLLEIVVPNSVTAISKGAFSGCSSLQHITIPFVGPKEVDATWQTWDADYPFGYIFGETEFDGSAAVKQEYHFFNTIQTTTYYIPATLRTVTVTGGTAVYGAFSNCNALTKIELSDVRTLMGYAFAGCSNLTDIIIPDIKGSIGESAFYDCTSLRNIMLPDAVTSIGKSAFLGCSSLSEMIIPNSIVTIGEMAFSGCSNLSQIAIPNSVATIGEAAFSNCSSLSKVGMSYYITVIDSSTFSGCSSLTEIVIPDRVSTIGDFAFAGCSSLIEIVIPDRVTSIGEGALSGCCKLESITLPFVGREKTNYQYATFGYIFGTNKYEGGLAATQHYVAINSYNEEVLTSSIFYIPSSLESVTLTGKNICQYAFEHCSGLRNVVISDGVTSIGDSAFAGCSSLTEIVIPDRVSTIGDFAFAGCSSLTEIVIPDCVSTIGDSAFKKCSGLTNIVVPNSVISIGQGIFSGCTSLTKITIPFVGSTAHTETSTSKSLFGYLFGTTSYRGTTATVQYYNANTGAYETYYIPDSLAFVTVTGGKISSRAFENCSNLLCIRLHDTVTAVGEYAFSGCNNLTHFLYEGTDEQWNAIANNVQTSPAIHHNNARDIAFSVHTNSCGYVIFDCTFCGTDSFLVREAPTHTYNGTNLCEKCKTDKAYKYSIEMDKTVTITGRDHFRGIVNIPSSIEGLPVTRLGNSAFTECSFASTFIIPDSVIAIGNSTFSGCGLTSIVIPDSVTSIGRKAFYDCDSLTKVTIGRGIISIGGDAFYSCNALTDVYIEDITAWCEIDFGLESNPLYHADNLYLNNKLVGELVIPEGVTEIRSNAFYHCNSLTSVVIPSSVTQIGDGAFYHCNSLTSVVIPSSVTRIGDMAFYYCGSLGHVFYAGTDEEWNEIVIEARNEELTQAVRHNNSERNCIQEVSSFSGTSWVCTICDSALKYQSMVDHIEITQLPNTLYYFGKKDKLDVTGGKVTVYRTDGGQIVIDLTAEMVTGFSNEIAGDKKLTVTIDGKKDTFIVNIFAATVTFLNIDGTVLSSKEYLYGDKVWPPQNPEKEADNAYIYTFSGWDKEVVDCTGNAIYTATYTSRYKEYTVTFVDEDGTELSSKTYHWGDAVTVPTNPVRAADNTYTYTFMGWDNDVVTNCAGNETYTATYMSTYINYTVVFKNWDGTVLSTKTYHYADKVSAPANPTKVADNTYTYAFAGWDKNVVNCAGNETYTATYTPAYINYTVTFQYADGTLISVKAYRYGDAVIIPENPAAPEEGYAFIGWDAEVVGCTGNATYTAVFEKVYVAGDIDGDNTVTQDDAVYLLLHTMFGEAFYPLENAPADIDGSGTVDQEDAVYLLLHTMFGETFYPLNTVALPVNTKE